MAEAERILMRNPISKTTMGALICVATLAGMLLKVITVEQTVALLAVAVAWIGKTAGDDKGGAA
jgi:hypothetical protein